ncbi:hypothetical protein TRICI_005810 [Trichomonascus ciferrii]|uniref:EamA domain-containing protein n=1 Tax=Trichomonascus ciferrii TaxID=44093 RepID=A0A642UR85_9ASCO|nr:hypothetical protein TRICI_005810 [Trichomonascus ciferrii]
MMPEMAETAGAGYAPVDTRENDESKDSFAIEDEESQTFIPGSARGSGSYIPYEAPPSYTRTTSQHRLKPSSDEEKQNAKKKKYIYAGVALVICLSAFVLQTETAGYLATTLNYKKPIFTLYLTHSSWIFIWPLQILFLRFRKLKYPFSTFLRRHLESNYQTASIVVSTQSSNPAQSPVRYIIKVSLLLFLALNFAGSSWYIAVNLTTPNDLTAIYNCSAFFAYAFSVPMLKEPFRWDKAFAVLLSIAGVVIVAYAGSSNKQDHETYPWRVTGNMVIGLGAVLYGLYEVMYKRLASPPVSVPPKKQIAFANIVGSTIGACTLSMLWIALPILHLLGWETFQLPTPYQGLILFLSLLGNVLFSAGFLILVSLTNPVLSSVAALLTTFLVPLVDFLLFGSEISGTDLIGGLLIIAAFVLLAYASWREIQEENIEADDDDDDEDQPQAEELHPATQ